MRGEGGAGFENTTWHPLNPDAIQNVMKHDAQQKGPIFSPSSLESDYEPRPTTDQGCRQFARHAPETHMCHPSS